MGNNNLKQCYAASFVSSWGRVLLIPMKGFIKRLVMILHKHNRPLKVAVLGPVLWLTPHTHTHNDSASCAQVFQSHKEFINGGEMVEDNPQSVRPSCVRTRTNVDHVRAFIHQD
jgi:hypothetical protein